MMKIILYIITTVYTINLLNKTSATYLRDENKNNNILKIKIINNENHEILLTPSRKMENYTFSNLNKELWLLDYKITTTTTSTRVISNFPPQTFQCSLEDDKSSPNIIMVNVLILAQQKSMARPRNLILSLKSHERGDQKVLKPTRVEFYHNIKKNVNPIILENNKYKNNFTSHLISLDKTIDKNYAKECEWLLDNKITSFSSHDFTKKLQYNEIKDKISFKIKYIYKMTKNNYCKEYIMKIYLTTDPNHFNYLDWTPKLQ